jgi:NTE family protein
VTGQRVVMVLGGGGAKAAAHLGAARALHERGLVPVHYVATSMGSVIAAMLAGGVDPDSALEQLTEPGAKAVVRPDPLAIIKGLWARSILRADALKAAIARLVPAQRFEDLTTPLTVTTADLDSSALILLGAGGVPAPLHDALYASCALPVFYPPFAFQGRRLADGGLRAVLPIEVALAFAPTLVVAVDVGPGIDDPPATVPSAFPPLVQAHSEGLGVLLAGQAALALERWRATAGRPPLIHVRPRIERGATFRVDRMRGYVDEGYRAASGALAGLNSRSG